MDPAVVVGKTFLLDFDFRDLPTAGIEGRVANVRPGPLAAFDRALGIEFTKIDPLLKRDLNRLVLADKARKRA
jgi:hypothetical protein